jgi:hypothetical protein
LNLFGRKDQPSEELVKPSIKLIGWSQRPTKRRTPTVIAEIWPGTSGRKLSAISFIPQSDATNRKKRRSTKGAKKNWLVAKTNQARKPTAKKLIPRSVGVPPPTENGRN